MECKEARELFFDRRRGSLDATTNVELEAHLASCAACRHEDAADAELSKALGQRLARPDAPESLKRALEERWLVRPRKKWGGIARTAAAVAVGAALAIMAVFAWHQREPGGELAAEAVNDHLRVLYSEHPLEVESGGIHRVKPWFEGRLDFAPIVDFAGDDDFPLEGGSVAYFIDRKAAAFVFRRRLHQITLFVFRADGLPWHAGGLRAIGAARGSVETLRGFHVALWRRGDLGYALVSDVNEDDLLKLGSKLALP